MRFPLFQIQMTIKISAAHNFTPDTVGSFHSLIPKAKVKYKSTKQGYIWKITQNIKHKLFKLFLDDLD